MCALRGNHKSAYWVNATANFVIILYFRFMLTQSHSFVLSCTLSSKFASQKNYGVNKLQKNSLRRKCLSVFYPSPTVYFIHVIGRFMYGTLVTEHDSHLIPAYIYGLLRIVGKLKTSLKSRDK